MNTLLENDLIKLRALELADIELLYQWENNTCFWHLSNTFAPYSRETLKNLIEEAKYDIFTTRQLRLVIEEKARHIPIGCVDLFEYDPIHQRAGIGILIAENDNRRKGYAKAAIQLTETYCKEVLFLFLLFCNVSEDNQESLALFQSLNYEICGIKKQWNRSKNGRSNELFLQKIL